MSFKLTEDFWAGLFFPLSVICVTFQIHGILQGRNALHFTWLDMMTNHLISRMRNLADAMHCVRAGVEGRVRRKSSILVQCTFVEQAGLSRYIFIFPVSWVCYICLWWKYWNLESRARDPRASQRWLWATWDGLFYIEAVSVFLTCPTMTLTWGGGGPENPSSWLGIMEYGLHWVHRSRYR